MDSPEKEAYVPILNCTALTSRTMTAITTTIAVNAAAAHDNTVAG